MPFSGGKRVRFLNLKKKTWTHKEVKDEDFAYIPKCKFTLEKHLFSNEVKLVPIWEN